MTADFGLIPLFWCPQGLQGCLVKQNCPLSLNLAVWCTKIESKSWNVQKTSEITRKTTKNDSFLMVFWSFWVLNPILCTLWRHNFETSQLKIGQCDLTPVWKGYLPNLLESAYLHQIFVFWDRDLKFWLQLHFLSPLKWQGQTWPNLTFWTQKWHISGKMHLPLFQNLCFLS